MGDESDIYAGGQASTAQTHGYTGWGEVQAPWQAHSTNTVYEGTGGFKPYYDNSQEGEKPRAGKRKDTARSRGNTSNVRFPNFEGKGVKPGSRQEETHTDRSRMDIKEAKARMLSTEEWLQYRQQRGDNIHYPRGGNKEMENDIITVDNLYSWVPPPKGPDVFTVNVESALKF